MKKYPFDVPTILRQIDRQVPEPSRTNHFKNWFLWVMEQLGEGTGKENLVLLDGFDAEYIAPYTGQDTTFLFTGEANGSQNTGTLLRIRWLDQLPVNKFVKLKFVVAQSIVNNNNGNISYTVNIETENVNLKQYSEPAIYSDYTATQHERSVTIKSSTAAFYLIKVIDKNTHLPVVWLYSADRTEATNSDNNGNGGGGPGGGPGESPDTEAN